MTLEQLDLPPITFHKAAHYTEGRVEKVIAIVNHRMVGTLKGTDAYFQNPETRPVSTHFGIGADSTTARVKIHQYVPLDDTAYGNGNYDNSGRWDNWGYPTTNLNARTISIEHQDIWGDDRLKGIVLPQVQEASQKLQALLRYGTVTQWKNAGITIRDWSDNAGVLRRELQAMPLDGQHIITHHDIAGNLKPYCWMPWAKDDKGFQRNVYVNNIQAFGTVLQKPAETVPVPSEPKIYTQTEMNLAKQAAYNAGAAGAETNCTAARTADQAEITRLNQILDQIEALAADHPA